MLAALPSNLGTLQALPLLLPCQPARRRSPLFINWQLSQVPFYNITLLGLCMANLQIAVQSVTSLIALRSAAREGCMA